MKRGTYQLPMAIRQSDGTWTKEIELEELTGEEEDILTDQTRSKDGRGKFAKSGAQRITEILSRCTVRIGSDRRPDGMDRFNAPAAFEDHWTKAYSEDRQFSMVRLRQLSLGDVYAFSENCPNCKKEIPRVEVNLATLKVTEWTLDQASQATHSIDIDGKVIDWRVLTGAYEDKLGELQKEFQDKLLSAAMYLRIVRIDGKNIHGKDEKDKAIDTMGIIRRLRSQERSKIREAFKSQAGIETDLQIICPNPDCAIEFTRTIGMNLSFFTQSGT